MKWRPCRQLSQKGSDLRAVTSHGQHGEWSQMMSKSETLKSWDFVCVFSLVFTIFLELSMKDGSIGLGSIAGMRKRDRLLTGCLRSFPMGSQCVSARNVA